MWNEEERALKCEHLATRFARAAKENDSTAAEFRRRADQKHREADEHPQVFKLREPAVEMMKAQDGLQGGANSWPISAPNSLFPRARTL